MRLKRVAPMPPLAYFAKVVMSLAVATIIVLAITLGALVGGSRRPAAVGRGGAGAGRGALPFSASWRSATWWARPPRRC